MSETPATLTPVVADNSLVAAEWATYVGAFARDINMTADAVTKVLLDKAVERADALGLATIGDSQDVKDEAWAAMFPAVKSGTLNRAVRTLRTALTPTAGPTPVPRSAPDGAMFMGLLAAPDDESLLRSLTLGAAYTGTISDEDAVSAVRVLFASKVGLYDVRANLLAMIEKTCEELDAPADPAVYALLDEVRERHYAEVLGPMRLKSSVVSDAAQKRFCDRAANVLFPAIRGFHGVLRGWYSTWQAQTNNPAALTTAMAAMVNAMANGGRMQPMPPTAGATPDTAVLVDASAELVTAVNKTFAGLSALPVARALAYDAIAIAKHLANPAMVTHCGAKNRDELLRKLRIGLGDGHVRQEAALAQYVLNALRIRTVPETELPMVAGSLFLVGETINWDNLGVNPRGADAASLNGGFRPFEEPSTNSRTRGVYGAGTR